MAGRIAQSEEERWTRNAKNILSDSSCRVGPIIERDCQKAMTFHQPRVEWNSLLDDS